MRKQYLVNQSPLFRLPSKAKLARLLDIDLKELRNVLSNTDNYRLGRVPKGDGSFRQIEEPKLVLKKLHKRLFRLLRRIELPGYLHSGTKGRSYITNASQHIGNTGLAKIDIKKFFPSTSFDHIKRGFAKTFECSLDVAYLIARLCTYDQHLPTGSSISCLMAYFAHKRMFDRIFQIASKRGWTITCYVDDITISGEGVDRRSLVAIKHEITRAGLSYHKERVFAPSKPKLVTGVINDGNELKLPNVRQRAIYDGLTSLGATSDAKARNILAQGLSGRANEAAQVDQRFRSRLPWLHAVINQS